MWASISKDVSPERELNESLIKFNGQMAFAGSAKVEVFIYRAFASRTTAGNGIARITKVKSYSHFFVCL